MSCRRKGAPPQMVNLNVYFYQTCGELTEDRQSSEVRPGLSASGCGRLVDFMTDLSDGDEE